MVKHPFVFLSLFFTLSAFAAKTPVMEAEVKRHFSEISTKIKVDPSSGEGSVQLKVYRRSSRHRGGSHRVLMLSQEAKVEGLALQGDKLIFRGETADVECGTMGVSRIFKIPTLFLSGRCDVKVYEVDRVLKVYFEAK